ncbi:hypothetical protein [Bradyrhizobium iriomotense]|uniref:hypothetical protein n=1 Tax=Bradyrhizobium iriomotense TaxID=441950 RepID=UPI001B8A67A3|nr:hypothetical protein [Bradyrhizobium iriomotense]MBR1133257.1 hypothetical protein [Bradyrhizobium iriomotense]
MGNVARDEGTTTCGAESDQKQAHDRFALVIARDVHFFPGARVYTYYAIGQPHYLTALAVTREERILLVRKYRPAIERFSLELPAELLEQTKIQRKL